MLYKVTKKYTGASAESPVGSYKTIPEAKKIIQEKLALDAMTKVNAIYCLYEFFDLIEEFDQSKLEVTEEQDSSSQQGNAQTFSPTPFNTSPQPTGMPRSWNKDTADPTKDEKNKG